MPTILLENLLIAIVIQLLFFLYAGIKKSDKVTDLSYSISFLLLILLNILRTDNVNGYKIVNAILVFIWGLRLGLYLFSRILKMKKDPRFDGIRENFFKFLGFWLFQGLSVFAILVPSIILINLPIIEFRNVSSPLFVLGVFVWIFGFGVEVLSDFQKSRFYKNPENKDKWIQTGIWRYSRHPNYFGEMVLWWGVFLLLVAVDTKYYYAISGPIYISILLLYISGIPPLEKYLDTKFGDDPNYLEYKKKTSIFVPLPTK
jgi:steroid 5-alpha reductase family enzyme